MAGYDGYAGARREEDRRVCRTFYLDRDIYDWLRGRAIALEDGRDQVVERVLRAGLEGLRERSALIRAEKRGPKDFESIFARLRREAPVKGGKLSSGRTTLQTAYLSPELDHELKGIGWRVDVNEFPDWLLREGRERIGAQLVAEAKRQKAAKARRELAAKIREAKAFLATCDQRKAEAIAFLAAHSEPADAQEPKAKPAKAAKSTGAAKRGAKPAAKAPLKASAKAPAKGRAKPALKAQGQAATRRGAKSSTAAR